MLGREKNQHTHKHTQLEADNMKASTKAPRKGTRMPERKKENSKKATTTKRSNNHKEKELKHKITRQLFQLKYIIIAFVDCYSTAE